MDQTCMTWLQTAPCLNRAEAWPAERFPEAEFRYFRDCGCLVCALAVMLRRCGLEASAEETCFDPWILNQRLIDCGAFTPAADLELSRISRLYPLEYLGAIPYTEEALQRADASGFPCLITVPGEKAERHFAALLDLLPDGGTVFDPACGIRRLRAYDRICEIRMFRLTKRETNAAEQKRDMRHDKKGKGGFTMEQIHLEKLTWDTADDVLKLRVAKEQKEFVASNSDSLIDAYFAVTEEGKTVYPFGIYRGKKAVGFLMISYHCVWRENLDFAKNSYYIWRFMIDKRYQGKGYGRAALQCAIDFIRTFPCGQAACCWLSYEPENAAAGKLYRSFGFVERPELCGEGEEIPAVLKL